MQSVCAVALCNRQLTVVNMTATVKEENYTSSPFAARSIGRKTESRQTKTLAFCL
uniref:Uncharacterized protein n=1 Tax=Octopus bimaculoides TaxID=37653 RepID=A0A0L8HET7_OCTBM